MKTEKPDRCENCGSERVAMILYGLVQIAGKLEGDLEERRVILGGCCIEEGSPQWRCLDCHHEWGDEGARIEKIRKKLESRWWEFWKRL